MSWDTSRRPGSTRKSRREREQVLQEWPTCYLRYDGCTIQSTEDDHVIPLSQGGRDDLDNRRGACKNCHAIKTRREAQQAKAARAQAQDEPHPGIITTRNIAPTLLPPRR